MNVLTRAPRWGVSEEAPTIWAVASLVLRYPSEELIDQLPPLASAAQEIPGSASVGLTGLINHLRTTSLSQLQRDYVATFDLKRKCSMYLSYFLNGDTRARGMALVRFVEAYRSAGVEVSADELPDYLPLVLEFAATVDEPVGVQLLVAHERGLQLLAMALHDLRSVYAGAIDAVLETLPPLDDAGRDELEQLVRAGPPSEMVGLEPFRSSDADDKGVRT